MQKTHLKAKGGGSVRGARERVCAKVGVRWRLGVPEEQAEALRVCGRVCAYVRECVRACAFV